MVKPISLEFRFSLENSNESIICSKGAKEKTQRGRSQLSDAAFSAKEFVIALIPLLEG